MFWSSPSADMEIMLFLLVVSLVAAVAVYAFSKRLLWSIFAFSVLSNLVFYFGLDYNLAVIYNIVWLFHFTRDIYPYINITLLILALVILFRKKYAK